MLLNHEDRSKEQKMIDTAEAANKIILEHGISGLTHTRLSQMSGVSRPWIYKYLGASKKAIINFAIDYFSNLFTEIKEDGVYEAEHWEENILSATERILIRTQQHPWFIPLYYKHANTNTVIGEIIKEKETEVIDKISHEFEVAYKVRPERARFIIQNQMHFQLSLAYQWTHSEDKSPEYRNQLVLFFKQWLRFVTTNFSENKEDSYLCL